MLNTKGFIQIDKRIRRQQQQLIKKKRSLKHTKLMIQKNRDKKIKYQLSTVKKAFKVSSLDDLVTTANHLVNQNKQLKAQLAQRQQPQQNNQSNNGF